MEVLVTKSCPTLFDPVDCSPPGSSVHGISPARILEWVAVLFSRGSSPSRNQTCVSCMWADSLESEPPGKPMFVLKDPQFLFSSLVPLTAHDRSLLRPARSQHRILLLLLFSHSVVSDSVIPWTAARQASLSFTFSKACSNSCLLSQSCHPTISSSVVPFSSCLQSFQASGSFPRSQFFASGGQSFSFSISPSNEYSGLISIRINWFDLLAVQGTLKSLLQHHSSKASILRCSAFFTVQLSHPYMITGKTIALTRWTFVGKVMSAFQYAV